MAEEEDTRVSAGSANDGVTSSSRPTGFYNEAGRAYAPWLTDDLDVNKINAMREKKAAEKRARESNSKGVLSAKRG